MIVLNPRKITGKALYRLLNDCRKTLEKHSGERITIKDFCEIIDVSRMNVNRWQRGVKPSDNLIMKVAESLTDAGFKVSIQWS